ncbi:MAG: hypothetical protein NTY24_10255 [Mycobacterium sp.]|jgi:hypothetical protein|nr:hypothetical protein [Mycobacterium sp.]MCX6480750.1 hypothetical protein [Mycobacterium sp.]
MSRFVKSFAANTFRVALGTAVGIAGLSCAALALSASAAAEPAPPPAIPGVPALSMLQQFATNPASMGAVLQSAATALNGASAMIGGPAASTLPVSPIAGAPGTAPVPDPAAGLPLGPGSSLVPLLNQLGVPASLANLTPADLPLQIGDTLGIAPAPVAAPVTGPLTTPPVSTIPLLPVPPVGSTGQMPLLNALP